MEWLPEWIDGWMNINVFSLLITIWVLKFWNHCMCVVELGKWVNILMLLKVREEYLQRISTSHLQIQNGENKEEPWGVLESEIDLECSPVTYDLSQAPQLSPLYLVLVRPLKTVVGLPLVNTFSAYVEKLQRVWRRAKTMRQRTRVCLFVFNLERKKLMK